MADGAKYARGRATRIDILNVARRLFSEHGYHRTGLSDIQTATGLTKGAFYHHFRSKEDLALAVIQLARDEYADQWLAPAMAETSPSGQIIALLDGLLTLNARPEWCNCQMLATLCAELTVADDRMRDSVREMQLSLLEMWHRLISEGQQRGDVNAALDPTTGAQWIVSTLMGMLLARKLGTLQVRPEQIMGELKHLLLVPVS